MIFSLANGEALSAGRDNVPFDSPQGDGFYYTLLNSDIPWWTLGLSVLLLMLLFLYVLKLRRSLRDFQSQLQQTRDDLESRIKIHNQELAKGKQAFERENRERGSLQRSLEVVSREYRLILNSAGEGIFGIDIYGNLTFINPAAEQLLERDADKMMGASVHSLTHHTKASGVPYPESECPIYAVMRSKVAARVSDDLFWRGDGSSFPVEYTATPMVEGGMVIGAVVIFEEISARKRAEETLRLSSVVYETTTEGVMVTDAANRIISVNPAFEQITGFLPNEVLGKTPACLASGRHDKAFYSQMWQQLIETGRWRGEIWNRRKNGEIFPEFLSINRVCNKEGITLNYVAVFSDISKIKESESKLKYLAHHDPLTSLPNRMLLSDRLNHAIVTASREKRKLAVLFLDLDNFKHINDTLGHEHGDTLLVNVAERLTECLRGGDTIARFGGDEFVIVLETIATMDKVEQVAGKILRQVQEPLILAEQEVVISVSVGIALFPEDASNAPDLIRLADIAMYRAKSAGRNRYCFYTADNLQEA